MKNSYSIFSVGDQAVSFEVAGSTIDRSLSKLLLTMKHWIHANSFDGLRDVILGYRSVTIAFDLYRASSTVQTGSVAAFVAAKLENAHSFAREHSALVVGKHVKIPVCYHAKFGFDVDRICLRNKISPEQLIALHSNAVYQVYLIGFLPGFPYLGFVDERIEAPRHDSPRALVPAGSVGIAGKQTGIYPFDSPGGWQIIGRTPVRLFNPKIHPPVLLEAGDTVSFYSIDEYEFDDLQNAIE